MKVKELFEDKEDLNNLKRTFKDVFGDLPKASLQSISCAHRRITSLEGAPKSLEGTFDCSKNLITSLEHAPEHIGHNFVCQDNRGITSLKDIQKHIKFIGNAAWFKKTPIKSHILGLLMIKGLKSVSFTDIKLQEIMNRHLAGDRDILECQSDLLDNNYDDYAQL